MQHQTHLAEPIAAQQSGFGVVMSAKVGLSKCEPLQFGNSTDASLRAQIRESNASGQIWAGEFRWVNTIDFRLQLSTERLTKEQDLSI